MLPSNSPFCCLLQRDPQQCYLITSLFLLNWTIWSKLTVRDPNLPVQPHLLALPSWYFDWSKAKFLATIWACCVLQGSVLHACTPQLWRSATLIQPQGPAQLSYLCDAFLTPHQRHGYSLFYALTIPYVHLLLLLHGVLEGSSLTWWKETM